MNYQEFERYKNAIDPSHNLLRLDCLNPFLAMDYLKDHSAKTSSKSHEDITIKALDTFTDLMKISQLKQSILVTKGVRSSLKGIFQYLKQEGGIELWLPQDVYPFYQDSAQRAGVSYKQFTTLPSPDFSELELASKYSLLVITNPVSPLGTFLSKQDVAALQDWLEHSPHRRLVLDCVYCYQCGFDKQTIALYDTGQCLLLHSLSKAWLERGIYGILVAPKKTEKEKLSRFIPQPSCNESQTALLALEKQPDLPQIQQGIFTQRWSDLLPKIQLLDPNFIPPQTGYFSLIHMPFETALQQYNCAVIPASVFGSDDKSLSIVTCL